MSKSTQALFLAVLATQIVACNPRTPLPEKPAAPTVEKREFVTEEQMLSMDIMRLSKEASALTVQVMSPHTKAEDKKKAQTKLNEISPKLKRLMEVKEYRYQLVRQLRATHAEMVNPKKDSDLTKLAEIYKEDKKRFMALSTKFIEEEKAIIKKLLVDKDAANNAIFIAAGLDPLSKVIVTKQIEATQLSMIIDSHEKRITGMRLMEAYVSLGSFPSDKHAPSNTESFDQKIMTYVQFQDHLKILKKDQVKNSLPVVLIYLENHKNYLKALQDDLTFIRRINLRANLDLGSDLLSKDEIETRKEELKGTEAYQPYLEKRLAAAKKDLKTLEEIEAFIKETK